MAHQSIYQQHDSVIGRFTKLIHNVSSQVLILIMTAVITLEVVFRYIFGAGFTWSQELCGLSFLLLVFLSQADTWQEDGHIRMDIFYNHFGTKFRKISDVLTVLCGSVLYFSIAWQSFIELEYQFEISESSEELLLPLWPFSLIIMLGSVATLVLLSRFAFLMVTGRKTVYNDQTAIIWMENHTKTEKENG